MNFGMVVVLAMFSASAAHATRATENPFMVCREKTNPKYLLSIFASGFVGFKPTHEHQIKKFPAEVKRAAAADGAEKVTIKWESVDSVSVYFEATLAAQGKVLRGEGTLVNSRNGGRKEIIGTPTKFDCFIALL